MAATGLFIFALLLSFSLFLIPAYARKLPLPAPWIMGLLVIKMFFALGYTYYFFHVHPHISDTWGYFAQSRQLVTQLIHTPGDFIDQAFPYMQGWRDMLHYPFWNSLKESLFVMILMAMNLVTGHNPYIDTVLYCLLTFTGWVSFLRLFKALYPGHAPWVYCLPFLFPTFLFCFSGLHSDGLVFALIGYIALHVYRLFLHSPGSGQKQTGARIRLILAVGLLACMKPYLAILLLPLIGSCWLVYHRDWRPFRGWLLVLASSMIIFLLSIPEQVLRRQMYLSDPGHAVVLDDKPMNSTLFDYIGHLPKAFVNAFLRPAPWETIYAKYIPSGLEVGLLCLLWVYTLLRVRRTFFEAGWMYFTAMNFLLIGYTIPIMGALVRYRSLFFPLLLAFSLFPLLRSRKAITKKIDIRNYPH